MALGETLLGITFMHDMVTAAVEGAPVKVVAPCEGTGYEIGSMSIIKGARNLDNAKKWYDWALSPEAQALAAQAKSYQVPSNRQAAALARKLRKIAIGGSDSHTMRGVGRTYTEVAQARTVAEFFAGLRARRGRVRGADGTCAGLTADVYRIIPAVLQEKPATLALLPLAVLVPCPAKMKVRSSVGSESSVRKFHPRSARTGIGGREGQISG